MATALAAMPTVKLEDVDFQQEGGEGDIVQGDVITCTAHVTLHRASHAHQGEHFGSLAFNLIPWMSRQLS